MTQENLEAEIHMVLVEDNESAAREKFLGSPSFRIDGQDLWLENRSSYNLGCRVYATDQGYKGYPSVEMLREKIRAFIQSAA